MKWVKIQNATEIDPTIYGRIDDDGLMRITAIEGYPELDEWLAEGNKPEVIDEAE
jgi:hypothetical protein